MEETLEGTIEEAQPPKPPPLELMIRQGKKLREGIRVQTVINEIKQGVLKHSDEISLDGEKWVRLDQHPKLSKLFVEQEKSGKSKKSGKEAKFFLLLIFTGLLAGGYLLPHITIYRIQSALVDNDAGRLSEFTSSPEITANFQRQIDTELEAGIKGKPYAESALPQARLAGQNMAASLVSHEALAGYLSPWQNAAPGGNVPAESESLIAPVMNFYGSFEHILTGLGWRYESHDKFLAESSVEDGKIEVVFMRQGIDWKISAINLPAESLRPFINNIIDTSLKEAKQKALADKRQKSQNKQQVAAAKVLKTKTAYKKKIRLKNLTVGKKGKYVFGGANPGVFGTVVNNGNKTVKELKITVYFYNQKGIPVGTVDLFPVTTKYMPGQDNSPLKSKKSRDFGYLVKEYAPRTWAGIVRAEVSDIVLVK